MERDVWLDKTVANVAHSIYTHIRNWDRPADGTALTQEGMEIKIRNDIRFALAGCYDAGFADGIAEVDMEDHEDETQLEFDLEDLKRIDDEEDDDEDDED